MHAYRGMTWDHPRGCAALAAAAAALDPGRDGLYIEWYRQPLEAFESGSIADLCARYDLVVLDHPHMGDAVEAECLQSLESLFGPDYVSALGAATIGDVLQSYRWDGRHWALPLDAASQVMAFRDDLLDAPAPRTWDDVLAFARTRGGIAMSLAGPHALLSFLSIAAAFGEAPASIAPDVLVSAETGLRAFDLMSELVMHSGTTLRQANPIGILEHMAMDDDVTLCPLVYGYVNYAAPERGHAIRFTNAPRAVADGRPGSTLGGTGIGISTRCDVAPELLRHLRWLLSEEAQKDFIPAHQGQPSLRVAWLDPAINARCGRFFSDTAETVDHACIRPRHAGYIEFQSEASRLLADALARSASAVTTVGRLQALYRASLATALTP